MYKFALDNRRSFQYANMLRFETPYLHASRLLDFHDFLYVLNGEWEIGLPGACYTAGAGDVLILPAGIRHYGITPCVPETRIIYFHIYPCDGDGPVVEEDENPSSVVLNSLIHTGENPHIRKLFERILQNKTRPELTSAYVNVLLYELGEYSRKRSDTSLAERIYTYAVNSPGILTNKEIADHFYVSRRTAETAFKKGYGMTIHEYVLRYRLEQAKMYLSDYPDLTLSALAQMLGFCDEHHLSRSFSKACGISPREYRKQKSSDR